MSTSGADRCRRELQDLVENWPLDKVGGEWRSGLTSFLAFNRILGRGVRVALPIWRRVAYLVEELERAAPDGAGMFDDLGDGVYGELVFEAFIESLREDLAAELDAAAALAREPGRAAA